MNQGLSSAISWSRRFLSLPTLFCLAVCVYVVFSGEHTVSQSIAYNREIDSLKAVLEANRDTMLLYKELNGRLGTDPNLMEQVVREQYGMKKPGEDVFKFEVTK